MNRLLPLLGIVLVAAGVPVVAAYLDIGRELRAHEALSATVDRVYHAQMVSGALKRIQKGDVTGAVLRLDLMVCQDILALNSQMASSDDQQRAYTQNGFELMARTRPSNAVITARTTRELLKDQIEAEKVLALADAGNTPINSRAAVSH